MGGWLLPLVEPYLDPGQCGGLSGTSTSHYLVKLLDFVHSTLDRRDPHAVTLATMDLSKAFNRGDSLVIEDLHDMHVPGWLLAILCSYLSNRSMVLTYQGATSTPHSLPGGYGAGTWMGGFLFTIKFNGICLRPKIPRPNGNRAMQLKYVDDSTKCASVNLKQSLQDDEQSRPFPLNYHERTKKCIKPDENVLQHELDRFHQETTENNFVTNQNKSFVMIFNKSRKLAFSPEFTLGSSGILEVKKTLKILGVHIQEDLKWGAQIENMVKKASKRIWLLRRMKKLGVDEQTMTNYWRSEGLVHLEAASAVWTGGITRAQQGDLSRVQRRAVAALTGRHTRGEEYAGICARLGLESDLVARRRRLATTFARRTAMGTKSRHKDLFTRLPGGMRTRSGRTWQEPVCRTRRYLNSAVPYLTRLLNQ